MLCFVVLVVLGVRWAGLGAEDFVLEADRGRFGIGVSSGGGVDVVIGPLVVGVALVFGIELCGAWEACSLCGRTRGPGNIGGVGDWSMVTDGGEEHMEDSSEDVEIHSVPSHVLHLGVEMRPSP